MTATHVKKRKLTSALEDYLEAIAVIREENGSVRVKDISKALKVSMPTVNAAIERLKVLGLVSHEAYSEVLLTKEAAAIAQGVKHRHETLSSFFSHILNIDPSVADRDACQIEHILSKETFEHLTKFMQFVKQCPITEGPSCIRNFSHFCEIGKRSGRSKEKGIPPLVM